MSTEGQLDVMTCALTGTHLIEASAGTGKTWTLCALYVRLLLEKGLKVQQLLVVTFTQAATAELRVRIRERLLQLRQAVSGQPGQTDPFTLAWVERLSVQEPQQRQQALSRLDVALASFDDAAIHTIHGFCRRALMDRPLASQQPWQQELRQDDTPMLTEAAYAVWRELTASLPAGGLLINELMRKGDSPESWMALLKDQQPRVTARRIWPPTLPNSQDSAVLSAQHAWKTAHETLSAQWSQRGAMLINSLESMREAGYFKGNVVKPPTLMAVKRLWDTLLSATAEASLGVKADDVKACSLLSTAGLRAAVKKEAQGQLPQDALLEAVDTWLAARSVAQGQARWLRLELMQRFIDKGLDHLRALKREQRLQSFDDLLTSLYHQLQGPQGQVLRDALRQRYPAALIDEFQDTDPLQWSSLSTLFHHPGGSLFLLGDPKQAIYSFRHADLHTYMQARRSASRTHTLRDNQRADASLIKALNGLFAQRDDTFVLPGLSCPPARLGSRPRQTFHDRGEDAAGLHLWWLGPTHDPALTPTRAQAMQAAAEATAADIAALLQRAAQGDVRVGSRALRASEVAVLVRTHQEGSRIRTALAQRGVAAVELSRVSVFHTPDALHLSLLLRCVAQPRSGPRVLALLGSPWMGLTSTQVHQARHDPAVMQAWAMRLQEYEGMFKRYGVAYLLRRFIEAEGVAARLLAQPDGARRLTNVLHLLELSHEAQQDHRSPEALLKWLNEQRQAAASGEELQQRLESDQHLVQIVTIHKAKGLEYPVVYCPFLWMQQTARGAGLTGYHYHDDDGRQCVDFRSPGDAGFDEAHIQHQVQQELRAEQMRLIYVALTRAQHRCVVVAGLYRTGHNAKSMAAASVQAVFHHLVNRQRNTSAAAGDPHPVETAWRHWAAQHADCVKWMPLPSPQAGQTLQVAPSTDPSRLQARPAPHIAPGWRLSSYSAWVRDGWASDGQSDADHDLGVQPALEVNGEADSAHPENLPGWHRHAPQEVEPDDILHFPQGPEAGQWLHGLLEKADLGAPQTWSDLIDAQGLSGQPGVRTLLSDLSQTPLPVGTSTPLVLGQLPATHRRCEMEFMLPSQGIQSHQVARCLNALGHSAAGLSFATLQGYLRGFIDMVFEHEGRYFVLDWKSNHLGWGASRYTRPQVEQAMQREGYHLQALIYSVAVHRLLQRRIPHYEPNQHWGGVVYLFIRGVRPSWQDAQGHPLGVYFERPDPQVLEMLSAYLDGTSRLDRAGRREVLA